MNTKILSRIISTCLASVLVLSLLSGCGSSDSSSGKVKILYSVADNDDTFRTSLAEGLAASASKHGVTLDMKLCGPSVQAQLDDITSAASNGYKAIICRPTDVSTTLQLECATSLPIVFVNNSPGKDLLKADKYVFAGSNEEDAGTLQVEYVLKKLGKPSSMNIIIMMGEKGHAAATGRSAAVKNSLQDAGVDYNIVFSDYSPSWSAEESINFMKTFYKTGQSVDAVFCNNDSLALGVVEAMKSHNIDPASVPICGVDATSDGCASIAAGEMSFTALQDAAGQGEAAVSAAILMGQGKSISSLDGATKDKCHVFVPFAPVDSSNVKQYQ